jgi:hypothetical protein
VFAENLQRYVSEEHALRRRDDRVSIILSIFLVAVMLALGADAQTAAITGSFSVVVFATFLTVRFCVAQKRVGISQHIDDRKLSVLYRPVSRRAAMATVPAIAVAIAILEAPEVGAAIIDRKLQKLATSDPSDKKTRDEVAATFREAARYKLKLAPESARIGARVATNSTLNIPSPVDMQGKPFVPPSEANGAFWSITPIATNTGPDNYATIGIARPPDLAEMLHIDDLPPNSSYGPAYLVVKGMDATLDNFRLKHVLFQDMRLSYHGGPLVLNQVYFVNCTFQVDPVVESWTLISKVIEGGWVKFSYVPNA